MTKVVLTNPATFVADASAVAQVTNNNAAVTVAVENTLSRDGTGPNQMAAPIDMNSNRILNLPVPVSPLEPVRLLDVSNAATLAGALAKTNNLSDLPNVTVARANLVLDQVNNTSDATKNAAAATLTNKTITSPLGIVKGDVGLGNVDNTSDVNKPVSTAQAAADALKANIASPTLTGVPAAPTAAVDTNTTQLATTAMVLGQAASTNPIVNGAVTVGVSTRFARADHVHPVDTSRQAALTAGQLPAEPSTGNATAGNVGEYVESIVATGVALSLTTGVAKTITNISLAAGDWDVSGSVSFNGTGGASVTFIEGSISLVTNTVDLTVGRNTQISQAANVSGSATSHSLPIGPVRFSLSVTTVIFLIADANFTVGTMAGFGIIRARRAR